MTVNDCGGAQHGKRVVDVVEDTYFLRDVHKLGDGEGSVERRVLGVRDDDRHGIWVARRSGPANFIAGVLDPKSRGRE